MLGWLLPRETSFFDFFDQHAVLIVQASEELSSLLLSTHTTAEKAEFIKQLEHKADLCTYHCIEALRKTFITPFERDDIYRLISRMDDIIDYIEETAARMALYKLTFIRQEAKDLADLLVHATQEVKKVVSGLRQLKNIKDMKKSFLIIHELENQADVILRESMGRLFDEEQDIRTLIKWKEIYENLENAMDRCEDVSNIIEGVILEYG